MNRFRGLTAVVTGGSKGIGAACVRRLAAEGAGVVFTYRSDEASAAAVAEQAGAKAQRADALDEERMKDFFKGVGRVNVLVNNVGGAWLAGLEHMTPELFQRVLGKNVYSLVIATREASPYFVNGSAVVNVSSVVADLNPVGDGMAMYNAAKSAVNSLTKTFAKELAPRGVRVNTVSPGPTETEGVAKRIDEMRLVASASPLGRMALPSEVAAVVAFLASADASMVTGETVRVSGGLGCG